MKKTMLAATTLIACWLALMLCLPARVALANDTHPLSVDSVRLATTQETQALDEIASSIASLPQKTLVRRRIAQATFCLPQNVLGTLFYGLLQLTGCVANTVELNEVKIIVTTAPIGVSLGRYIFVHTSLQTENAIRHEYGHVLQGYIHGPFYLLFEGAISFTQCALSLLSPSFARDYFERWPENEANELGGVTLNQLRL